MKQRIMILLALVTATVTVSAYNLKTGTSAHGTLTFKVGGIPVTTADAGATVTVEISPTTGYATAGATAETYGTWGEAQAPSRAPEIAGVTLNKKGENTYTLVMPEANVAVSATYTKVVQAAWITVTGTATYSGEAQKPAITVKDGSTTLSEGTDYTVAYTDNINAGVNTATVTITGQGSYSGTASAKFSIAKAEPQVTAPTPKAGLSYTGSPLVLINAGSVVGGSMEYSLDNATWSAELPTGIAAQSYTVYYRVNGDANHEDVAAKSITAAISKAGAPTVTKAPEAIAGLKYTGSAQTLITAGTASTGELEYKVGEGAWSTSLPTGTDAGDYTVSYRVKASDNYEASETQTLQASIAKAVLTVTPPTALTNLTYTGSAQTLIQAGNVSPSATGRLWYALPGTALRPALPTGTNAGDYTVTYKAVSTDKNYADGTEQTLKVTIAKATPTILTVPAAKTGLKYNGAQQELITAGSTKGGTMVYSLDGTSWDASIPTGMAVKTYTIYYRVNEDANYTNLAGGTVQVTIAKGIPVVTKAPAAITGLTYNGQEQALVEAGTTTGGVLEYSLDGNVWKSQVPTAQNAGTYNVQYRIMADGNYEAASGGTVLAAIGKATPVVTAPVRNEGLTYTGQDQQLLKTAATTTGGTVEYSVDNGTTWTTTLPVAKDAKTHVVYYRVKGDGNYNDVAQNAIAVTIAHAVPTVSVAAVANLTYKGTPQTLITEGTVIPAGVASLEYKLDNGTWGTALPQATNAGEYTVYYYARSTNSNYKDSEVASLKVTIGKATPILTPPTAKTGLIYTGAQQELITAGSTTGGTLQYSLGGTQWITALPKGLNAGNYTVYYRVVGGSNYSDIGSQSITVTIGKATPVVTKAPAAVANLAYTGNAQTLITAGTASVGTLEYRVGTGAWSTSLPTGTAAGDYTVSYRVKASENYDASAEQSLTVKIAKATPVVTAPKAVANLVYNGYNLVLITAGTTTGGTMEYSLDNGVNWNYELPKGKDAKTYTVSYRVVGNSNYNDVAPQSIQVTIAQATPVVTTAPKALVGLVYNGSAQTLVTAGAATGGTIEYSLDNKTWSEKLPQGTNAGTYTVWYHVKGDANFKSLDAKSITATIAQATPTMVAPTAVTGLTYTGQPQTLVQAGSATPTGSATMQYSTNAGQTWTATLPTGTDAGTYTVYYKVVHANDNYTDAGPKSLTVTIGKGTPVVTPPTQAPNLYYTGSPLTLITAATTTGGTLQYRLGSGSWSTALPTATNVGSYTVWYRVAGNNNYTDVAASSITVTILKSRPVVTPPVVDQALVYTGGYHKLLLYGATTTHGKVVYSLDGKDYSEAIPEGDDAGNYTIYYKVIGDDNYDAWGPETITASIQKAVPSVLAPRPLSLLYNGEYQDLVVEGWTSIGTMEYSLNGTTWIGYMVPYAKEAKTYKVYYRVVGDKNIEGFGPAYVTAVIYKEKPADITAPVAKTDLKYTGQAQELVTAGSVTGGVMHYSLDNQTYSAELPKGTDAGTYTVWYKVIGTGSYGDTDPVSLTVSIAKVASSATAPKAKSGLKYTGQPQVLVDAGTPVGGVMHYSLDNQTYSAELPKGTDAGTYTVYYKVVGDKNHTDLAAQSIKAAIDKATGGLTAPTAKTGLVYTGVAQELVNAGSVIGTTLQYSKGGTEWTTTLPTGINAGSYTVYYRALGNTNHQGIPITSLVVSIGKAVPVITEPKPIENLVYNGKAQTLITAGTSTTLQMEYSLNGTDWSATELPQGGIAGDYTVYYRVPGSSNTEALAARTVKATIAKADVTYTAPKAVEDLIADGTPKVLITAGTCKGGEMQYSLDGKTYSVELPTAIEGDEYTVYYRVVGDQNHKDVDAQTLTVVITNQALKLKEDEGPVVNVGGERYYALDASEAEVPYVNEFGVNTAARGRIINGKNGLHVVPGSNIRLVIVGLKAGNILRVDFTGNIECSEGVLKVKGSKAPQRAMGFELVSGTDYVVQDDCDLILELLTQDGPVDIHNITVDRTTDIGLVGIDDADGKDVWYDLQGHKYDRKPTKKGVYIYNGRQVVVK